MLLESSRHPRRILTNRVLETYDKPMNESMNELMKPDSKAKEQKEQELREQRARQMEQMEAQTWKTIWTTQFVTFRAHLHFQCRVPKGEE